MAISTVNNYRGYHNSVSASKARDIQESVIGDEPARTGAKVDADGKESLDSIEISEEGRLAAEQEKQTKSAQPAPVEEEKDEVSESQGGKVGINAGKLARMLAAAKTRSQVQAVVAKIQADLNECDAGKEQGMDVDEASVRAAEQLLQQAKSRMGSAENREATPEEELASALAGLM